VVTKLDWWYLATYFAALISNSPSIPKTPIPP
jgi:hypothetical protein